MIVFSGVYSQDRVHVIAAMKPIQFSICPEHEAPMTACYRQGEGKQTDQEKKVKKYCSLGNEKGLYQ